MVEGQVRIPAGCAISGIFSKSGNMINGEKIIRSISVMHVRSNGLGGRLCRVWHLPAVQRFYRFACVLQHPKGERRMRKIFRAALTSSTYPKSPPTKRPKSPTEPLIWRYFVTPLPTKLAASHLDEKEFIVQSVLRINTQIEGAYVFSSGKNMGVFKAVGFPEDVGHFYRLDEYEGYSWTAHGRYPTNTPGWWGGAHPFAMLDYSIVHNGEISSYDANRRYIEMFGYKCTLLTDTEVITYIIDFLVRKKGLTLQEMAQVIAAPFWSTIQKRPPQERERLTYLRNAFSSLLITGPFSILLGFEGGMMALNDRLKLRSMVIGEQNDMVYMASEESAIRVIAPDLQRVYSPKGGEPVIVTLEEGVL